MYDSEDRLQTKCSSMSPKSKEMAPFYCLIDPILQMKSCGLDNVTSSENLEPLTANRSVTINNIKKSSGNVCYFRFKSSKTWTKNSTINIYPSIMKNVKITMTRGADRFNVTTAFTDKQVNSTVPYKFNVSQEVYLLIAAESDFNEFVFKYSIEGEVMA